jgi:hypothetical protein
MSSTTAITPEQAVELVTKLRALGVTRFSYGAFRCQIEPKVEMSSNLELAAKLGELPLEDRKAILDQAKKEMDEDLYGAVQS